MAAHPCGGDSPRLLETPSTPASEIRESQTLLKSVRGGGSVRRNQWACDQEPHIKRPGPDTLWAGPEVLISVSSRDQASWVMRRPSWSRGRLPSQPPPSLSLSTRRCSPPLRDSAGAWVPVPFDSGRFVGRRGRAASRALVCDTADPAEAKPFQGLQEVRAWAEHAHTLGCAAGRAPRAQLPPRPPTFLGPRHRCAGLTQVAHQLLPTFKWHGAHRGLRGNTSVPPHGGTSQDSGHQQSSIKISTHTAPSPPAFRTHSRTGACQTVCRVLTGDEGLRGIIAVLSKVRGEKRFPDSSTLRSESLWKSAWIFLRT